MTDEKFCSRVADRLQEIIPQRLEEEFGISTNLTIVYTQGFHILDLNLILLLNRLLIQAHSYALS